MMTLAILSRLLRLHVTCTADAGNCSASSCPSCGSRLSGRVFAFCWGIVCYSSSWSGVACSGGRLDH